MDFRGSPWPWTGLMIALAVLLQQAIAHLSGDGPSFVASMWQVGVMALGLSSLGLVLLPPRRVAFALGFLVCAGLLAWAFWLEHIEGLDPCPLCMFQRVAFVAIALVLGLDAPLAVVVVLAGTALVPLTLPVAADALVGVSIEMPLAEFMARLLALVGSAFAAAWLVRRLVPAPALAARRELLDGLAVVNLLLFGLAIMDGVTAYAIARPGYVALAIVAAYAFNLLLQAAGALAFRRLGPTRALTVALLAGNCNMGLVLVALEGRASFDVTVYFALAQIPMYTLPALLEPLYARFGGAPPPAG